MRTIYTHGLVGTDGRLSAPVPCDIARGEHRVVIVIEEPCAASPRHGRAELPALALKPRSARPLLRRR